MDLEKFLNRCLNYGILKKDIAEESGLNSSDISNALKAERLKEKIINAGMILLKRKKLELKREN